MDYTRNNCWFDIDKKILLKYYNIDNLDVTSCYRCGYIVPNFMPIIDSNLCLWNNFINRKRPWGYSYEKKEGLVYNFSEVMLSRELDLSGKKYVAVKIQYQYETYAIIGRCDTVFINKGKERYISCDTTFKKVSDGFGGWGIEEKYYSRELWVFIDTKTGDIIKDLGVKEKYDDFPQIDTVLSAPIWREVVEAEAKKLQEMKEAKAKLDAITDIKYLKYNRYIIEK
jgi:hypothetical protein